MWANAVPLIKERWDGAPVARMQFNALNEVQSSA
jgi:hypothetical protein